ncbi:MAG: hypothetical protein HRU19_05315 [Pseudobacteriovorax sp.]|nr:hypothetical protein [Pseudobacteriovorax sp.]
MRKALSLVACASLSLLLTACNDAQLQSSEKSEKVEEISSPTADLEAAEAVNEVDAETAITVAEPAMVGGAFLYCASTEIDDDTESIGCAMQDPEGNNIPLDGVMLKAAYAIYPEGAVEIFSIEDEVDDQDRWQFIFEIPRNALRIKIVLIDQDGTEYTSEEPVMAALTGAPRFAYRSNDNGDFIHLGDGFTNTGDVCEEALDEPNVLNNQTFLKGKRATIEFSVAADSQQTSIALDGVCDVQHNGTRMIFYEYLFNTFIPVSVTVLEDYSGENFFEGELKAGTYKIELFSGSSLGLFDEFLFKGVKVKSDQQVTFKPWVFE